MKIVKQLSEHQFVIDMSDEDPKDKSLHFFACHDYVSVSTQQTVVAHPEMKESFYGPHKFCSNAINVHNRVQIGISAFNKIVMPNLASNEYCQPEHTRERYFTDQEIFYYLGEIPMVAIPDMKTQTYDHMKVSTYRKLKGLPND